MRTDISKLMEEAKKQLAEQKEKRGYVVRDYGFDSPGGGWKCAITTPEAARAEKSFATKEEAIQWGEAHSIEPPGYLLVMNC